MQNKIKLRGNLAVIIMQNFEKYLNPIYKDIEEISNFKDLIPDTELSKEEYPNLIKVTNITKSKLLILLNNLKRLEEQLERQIEEIDAETDSDEKKAARAVYNKILTEIEIIVGRINNELVTFDSPYFGKILFTPYDTKRDIKIYIGKFALIDKETQIPLITDWRSPIANIYYQNTGPQVDVSFQAPIGIRRGDLKQKRQFQISRARIQGIYDAKSGNVAADEFLLSQLEHRIGKKLQDIVSTIQTQQNEIIREEINHPVVIQGVAGSGKTTILLHRLAYLFYTYPKLINESNSLIIASNQMFIDYVSDVLPNLGVRKGEIMTYLFWAKKVLGWGDFFTISLEKENLPIKKLKGSKQFIDILNRYYEQFEKKILENLPTSLSDKISLRYYQLKEEFKDIDMVERISLAIEYAYAQGRFSKYKQGEIRINTEEIEGKKAKVLAYVRKETDIYQLYKNLFKTKLVNDEISTYSLQGLKHNGRIRTLRIEDLAPIVYLHFKVYGAKLSERQYIMIDEAQDMSLIQLFTLSQIAKNGNITIAGDLAQSIIPPFYLESWDEVFEILDLNSKNKYTYHQLQKCYRTTEEIVNFGNKIFKEHFPKSYQLPEAVLRHGEKVSIFEFNQDFIKIQNSDLKQVINTIKDYFNKGSITCAILARNKEHAKKIFAFLKPYEKDIGREIIDFSENNYKTGLLILPIDLAKGLEFDSIIIADVNSNYYSNDTLSFKLLYVGITRALHRLCIITKKNDKFSEKFSN